jgi:N-acetylneuraminate synthase
MKIADREIGSGHPTFVVAEISCNHNGVFENARKLIHAAYNIGADAVKFQCYTPGEMVPEGGNREPYILTSGPWAGWDLWELYTEAMTPKYWFADMFAYARELGLIPFASVFSQYGIDFLEKLNCPAYKIASPEIGDLGLIRAVVATGKPVVVSTGAASEEDVDDAVEVILGNCTGYEAIRAEKFALLHCISAYPAPDESMGLTRIRKMRQDFWYGVPIGLSDHSRGSLAAVAAVAMGANIIEKHIKLPGIKTFDSEFSATPQVFKAMVDKIRRVEAMMQATDDEAEAPAQQWKRRLIFKRAVAVNTTLTTEDIRTGRCSIGLPPSADIVGKKTTRDVEPDEPVTEEMVK